MFLLKAEINSLLLLFYIMFYENYNSYCIVNFINQHVFLWFILSTLILFYETISIVMVCVPCVKNATLFFYLAF